MLILPAMDIMDGQCVRLRQGDFSEKTVYSSAPADVARSFADDGAEMLHVVDLDGARNGAVVSWKTIASIAAVPGIKIEVGGGVRSDEDVQRLLDVGVHRVVVGSIAVKSPSTVERWIRVFGAERIVVGADMRNNVIAVSGWMEESPIKPEAFFHDMRERNVRTFICTDVARDGMLGGPNTNLYERLTGLFPDIELIASGGISTLQDVVEVKRVGCGGVIVGKAIYEGRVNVKELIAAGSDAC